MTPDYSSAKLLLQWYQLEKRPLPWRVNRDPYRIWLSEVMLQQTTVRAVIPYYERFLARFPTLAELAAAEEGEVLELWTGLGYYSRARNVLKAARELAKLQHFPRSHVELLNFPGFGPYTARAVSSIAFDEPVGVVDGNVIRVLTRLLNLDVSWWLPKEREHLQMLADKFAQNGPSSEINQALMELGATVCTPANPACLMCPLQKRCSALAKGTVDQLPRQRPRRAREIWLWEAIVHHRKGRLALVTNDYAPFLSGQLICPGSAKKLRSAPAKFDFRHSVTHHDIFVLVKVAKALKWKQIHWIDQDNLRRRVPLALVHKTLDHANKRQRL